MIDILLAGGTLSIPFLLIPNEWAENPKVQPWVERLLIGAVAFWCLNFLMMANEVVNGG